MVVLDRPVFTGTARRWLLFILLAVFEIDFFVTPHKVEWQTLQAPAWYFVVTIVSIAILLVLLVGDRLEGAHYQASSTLSCLLHVGVFAFLAVLMAGPHPPTGSEVIDFLLSLPVFGLLAWSWLSALLPLRLWKKVWKKHSRWVTGAITTSALTIWMGTSAITYWVHDLTMATYYGVSMLLPIWFTPVTDPTTATIGTANFQIKILSDCSGYEGMGLGAFFVLAYLWIRRSENALSQALWMVPVAMLGMWIANLLRVVLLIVVGSRLSADVAAQTFHTHAGWIMLTVVATGMVLMGESERWHGPDGRKVRSREYPAAAYLLPLLTLLFGRMLTQAVTMGLEALYPLAIGACACVLYFYRDRWMPMLQQVAWGPSAALGFGTYVVWALLAHPASIATDNPFHALAWPLALLWILCRMVGAVVIVPIAEELAFRGYLLRRLQGKRFDKVEMGEMTPFAVIASSLLFGSLHQQWLAATLAGVIYAFATRPRGRLGEAMIAHGVTNLCLAVQVLLCQQWGLWG